MSKLNRVLDILFATVTIYTLIHALASGDTQLAVWVVVAGIWWALNIAKDMEITRLRVSRHRLARRFTHEHTDDQWQACADAARKDNA